MPFVVTIDQRASRRGEDAVDAVTAQLNARYAGKLRLPFIRTVGDEAQALLGDPTALVGIVADLARADTWWIGVGAGPIEEPLGEDARSSRGASFYAARAAVDGLKNARAHRIVALKSAVPGEDADALARVLQTLVFLIRRRTPSQHAVADLAREGASSSAIAKQLGHSRQAVVKQLRVAGFEEEVGMREVAALLARRAGT